MAKDPSFPFYAQDFLVDTLRWSRDMKSLHVDLMCEAWANKEIRDDSGFPEGLSEADKKIWLKIKHKWNLVDGVWTSGKLEEVRVRRKKFIQHQSDNGKKGGRPKNPNKTQIKPNAKPKKKPLENEHEHEKEKEVEYEIENPFGEFEYWKGWCDYKKSEWGQSYKDPRTETAALNKLFTLSRGDPETAKKIIEQSISSQWKGLFELKNPQNGSGKTSSKVDGQQLNEAFAKFYSKT